VSLVEERRQLTLMWCSMAVASELARQLDPEEQHEVILRAQTLFGEVMRRFAGYMA
jgi:class 3 adenylate cyclase